MPVRPAAIDRVTFLLQTAGGLAALVFLDGNGMNGMTRLGQVHCEHESGPAVVDEPLEHPEPREGITAERVLSVETLGGAASKPKVAAAYEYARNYPAIFDGIACSCSCGGKKKTHRSLLLCYETAQATGCGECQLEGELVGRLAKEGKTLAEIRKAVDKEFG